MKTTKKLALGAALVLFGCGEGTAGSSSSDETAPTITAASPADMTLSVSRATSVALTFSEPVDTTSVTPTTVVWTDELNNAVAYASTYDAATYVLTLTPTATLAAYRDYVVEVTTAVADPVGNHLAASYLLHFTTADDVAPETLVAPTDAGAFSTAAVAFNWLAAVDEGSGVTSYVLQISTDASGTNIVFDNDVGDVLHYSHMGTDGQVLYARVAAVDLADNQGAFSAFSDGVTVDAVAPAAPATPGDSGDYSDSPVAFTWSAVVDSTGSGLGSYVLRIATANDGSGIVFTSPAQGTTGPFLYNFDAASVTENTTLYANVAAVDSAGNVSDYSDWSNGVLVDKNPPTVPGVPDDGGDGSSSTTLHFVWDASSDVASGVKDYVVEIATNSGGTRTLIATSTPVTVPAFDYVYTGTQPMRLDARVRAADMLDHTSAFSDWSDGIVIRNDIPLQPGTPSDGAEYSSSTMLTFTWTAPASGPAVDHYVIEIGTLPGADDVSVGATLNGSTFIYSFDTATLANGQTYYAHVAGAASDGLAGLWSASSDGVMVDTTAPTAPGAPEGPLAIEDASVTFTWTAASDNESGVKSYGIEIVNDAGGAVLHSASGLTTTTYTYDGSGLDDVTITARVRAYNRTDTAGSWSPSSDAVTVDGIAPTVYWASPSSDWTQPAPTNTDIVIQFSEPMNTASVAAALSLTWDTNQHPLHGYLLGWNAAYDQITIVPDTQNPAGATNIDVLPAAELFALAVAATATDTVGNAMSSAYATSFSTSDETPPAPASIMAGSANALLQPVAVADVVAGSALTATFNEDMDRRSGEVRVEGIGTSMRSNYGWMGINGVTTGGGAATYTPSSMTPSAAIGDYVSVEGCNPSTLDGAGVVTAVNGSTGAFTITSSASGVYVGGCQASLPSGEGARINWTGARTLTITLARSLLPAHEYRLELQEFRDVAGNSGWHETSLQVRSTATDTTAPSVYATPVGGATGVRRLRPIFFAFTEPVDKSTIDLQVAGGGLLAADFSWQYSSDEMGPTLVVVPQRALPASTEVTLILPATLADLAGNALGTAYSLAFTTGTDNDTTAPQLFETLPTDLSATRDIWSPEMSFANGASIALDALDATTVGAEDFRVINTTTSLLVRGWSVEVDPASPVVRLQSPPRGSGLSTGPGGANVVSVESMGGNTFYALDAVHNLRPGSWVSVRVETSGYEGYGVENAQVLGSTGAQSFVVLTGHPFLTLTSVDGWTSWQVDTTYSISIDPDLGGTGISDAFGNAFEPDSFSFTITPEPLDCTPLVRSLRDVRMAASVSPMGRSIEASFEAYDPNDENVNASWVGQGTNGPATLDDMDAVLTSSDRDYRYPENAGGPPDGTRPSQFDATDFPGADFYSITATLTDASTASSSYTRQVYVWPTSALPQLVSITDGATDKPVDSARPVVITDATQPVFHWTNADASADVLATYIIDTSGMNSQYALEYQTTTLLAPQVSQLQAPQPLVANVYLWTVAQMRMQPNASGYLGQGWALDSSVPFRAMFVYGPDNDTLANRVFCTAQIGLTTSSDLATFQGAWDNRGLMQMEAASAGVTPELVRLTLVDNNTVSTTPAELFAYDATNPFLVITRAPTNGGLPLPGKGFFGRGGELLAVAQAGDSTEPYITIATHRYTPTGPGYGTSLTSNLVIAHVEATMSAGNLTAVGGLVGVVTPSGANLVMSGIDNRGAAVSGSTPYTLNNGTGLLELDIGSAPGSEYASGYLGGTEAAPLVSLAATSTPNRVWFTFAATEYVWLDTETAALLNGRYQMVDFALTPQDLGASDPTVLDDARAAWGSVDFDGLGGFTYEMYSRTGASSGSGTYTVNTTTHRVSIIATHDGGSGTSTSELMVGPDFDTLLGITTRSDRDTAELLLLSK